jgi:hypothetical protein
MSESSRAGISSWQLLCLLLLSHFAAEFVSAQSGSGLTGGAVIAEIAAEAIRFALALPVIIYSFKGNDFYGAARRKSRVIGAVTSFGAVLLLASAAVKTLSETSKFAARNLLPKQSPWLIAVILAAFAVYAAYTGAEAIARSGAILLIAAGIAVAFTVIADIPYMKIPRFGQEYDGFFGELVRRLLCGGDYLIFAALLPYVKPAKRLSAGLCGVMYALFGALASTLLTGACLLTLGEFFGLAEYPLTAAASLADIAVFKRLDGLLSAVLALCAALRAGLLLFCAWSVLREFAAAFKRSKVTKSAKASDNGSAE